MPPRPANAPVAASRMPPSVAIVCASACMRSRSGRSRTVMRWSCRRGVRRSRGRGAELPARQHFPRRAARSARRWGTDRSSGEAAPSSAGTRASREAHRVRFARIPPDEQQVATRDLEAASQLVPLVAGIDAMMDCACSKAARSGYPRLRERRARRPRGSSATRVRKLATRSDDRQREAEDRDRKENADRHVSVCDSIGPVPFSSNDSR